ncbi:MAG: hypothetical protein KGI60_00880 [Patescibacteria group bacterium]|nr:hypothetical protein [Patescibacteria group bacterium]
MYRIVYVGSIRFVLVKDEERSEWYLFDAFEVGSFESWYKEYEFYRQISARKEAGEKLFKKVEPTNELLHRVLSRLYHDGLYLCPQTSFASLEDVWKWCWKSLNPWGKERRPAPNKNVGEVTESDLAWILQQFGR